MAARMSCPRSTESGCVTLPPTSDRSSRTTVKKTIVEKADKARADAVEAARERLASAPKPEGEPERDASNAKPEGEPATGKRA